MIFKRVALVGLLVGAGIATSACTDGYGYSGVAVGYGTGGYYGDGYGYADPYYGGYGYGGYPSYFGWYGDYYYPGTGIYVYDQYRRPYRWNDSQRRYWEGRRNTWRGDRNFRNDWNGFNRPPDGRGTPGQQNWGNRRQDGRDWSNRNWNNRDWGNRDGNRENRRETWRGNRQNFSGQAAPTPPPAGTTPAPQPQWRGNRSWNGGNNRGWNGNRGWGGGRGGRGAPRPAQ